MTNKIKFSIVMGVMMLGLLGGYVPESEASSYNDYGDLTVQELNIYTAHPYIAEKAKLAASDARSSAQSNWKGYTQYQGNGDAYRHAYWSALMTKRIGKDWAYKIGLAHEGLKESYSFSKIEDDNKMDVSNNYYGRTIGEKYSYCTDKTISEILIVHTKKGQMKRIRKYSKNSTDKIKGVGTTYTGYYINTSDGGFIG